MFSMVDCLNVYFTISGDNYDAETKKWDPSGNHMISQQDFWFVLGMTVFILIPWFTVREVKGERHDRSLSHPKVLTIMLS